MAKIGMEYVCSGILTEDSTSGEASYTDGRYWGPASSFNLTTSSNEVNDYGDDRVVETDKTLNSIGISVELNELTLELESVLLGHTYDSSSKEMTVTNSDVAPWVGIGCIGKTRRNNTTVYRGIFLYKAQFSTPSDENSTKQESTSFNHTTFDGTAYPLKNTAGDIQIKKEFTTLALAKTWLNGLLNISE